MKVTSVNVHVVSVPFTRPETWRFGRMWGLTNAIVEVRTDEGITGIGEVPGSPTIGLVREALATTADWIIGEDPLKVSQFLRRAADGALAALKFPREGAGLLSSLVDTDGLVELPEAVTAVAPGDMVGFLGYANLM